MQDEIQEQQVKEEFAVVEDETTTENMATSDAEEPDISVLLAKIEEAAGSEPEQKSIPIRIENSVLDVQVEMLRKEYDMVQEEIREFSKKSQSCRNWTITLWAGSIAFAISPSEGNARSFIILSILFPLMFWLQDIKWTQLQRIFIFRGRAISNFFGGEAFIRSVSLGHIVRFDMNGLRKTLDYELFKDSEYKKFASFWRVMFFGTKVTFYPVLMIATLIIHAYFNFEDVLHYYYLAVGSISPPP